MEISIEKIAEYIRKASMYDAIINYTKASMYFSREDILAFAGEPDTAEKAEDITDGNF